MIAKGNTLVYVLFKFSYRFLVTCSGFRLLAICASLVPWFRCCGPSRHVFKVEKVLFEEKILLVSGLKKAFLLSLFLNKRISDNTLTETMFLHHCMPMYSFVEKTGALTNVLKNRYFTNILNKKVLY